ncbi:MAG: aldehyde dehydrogenase family protein [Betaproteobacteria bacterium]|nr:aldehyde dehydrogenase family protein [Betaproteobacteria bacterium]
MSSTSKTPMTLESVMPRHRSLFMDGAWCEPLDGAYVQTLNPANGQTLTSVANASAADVDQAVAAARKAFHGWSALPPLERARYLRQAAQVLREHAEELAMIDAFNTGNPVAEMVRDAQVAATGLEFFAGLITQIKGETIPMGEGMLNYTRREPLGVVARIVAYNHPLMFAAVKIGAPLAAGNTVIVKPPEQAPLSSLRMAELIGSVFPPGVLNVLPGGKACGQALSTHPHIAKVTLIGSVPTGKAIMRSAADTLKPVLLELGGKNALIVYPDADLDQVVTGAVKGMNFTWAGQSCGSTSRMFLHDSVYDQVLPRVIQRIQEQHKPGIPTDFATTMGPVVSQAQLDKVLHYIEAGKQDGAKLLLGGKRCTEPHLKEGYFVEPTVFGEVKPGMRLAQEEVFGPILSVFRWSDEDQLFDAVNGVDYGLTCSIWTCDLKTAHRAAARAQAGYVWINNASQHFFAAPFGGYKQSGIGREECFEELLEFTQIKNINVTL